MKKIVFLVLLATGILCAQEKSQRISGVVTDGLMPLKNVKIEVQGNEISSYTDAKGRYSVEAAPGNTIAYSYVGFKTVEIRVEDVTRILNVEMYPDIEELDEVVVTKSNRKSQQELELEYNSNPNLIKTAYGIINPETSAYQIRILSEEYISSVNLCILDVLRNEFPGILISGDCSNGGGVNVRGSSSLFNDQSAIFDIDGQILTDAPVWILPSNMKRVAVLSSFAATTKYGAIASGGVVIINTNSGNSFPQSKELQDKARLRNNIYRGDALSSGDLFNDQPIYLQELKESNSFEEARKIYEYYADKYGSSYSFAIDAIRYFSKNWNDDEFVDKITNDAYKTFETNPVAIKALAYILEENGKYEKSHDLYKEVFILRPNYAQSYMDIANSYRNNDQSKAAAAIYSRYNFLIDQGFLRNDSTAFATIIDREFNNLLALNGNEIISKNARKHVLEDDFNGTRLVFEWNDSEAEFELQFVNPEGHYSLTKHTLLANSDRIRDEKFYGFSCEEFLIDGSLPGNWQVNARYLGNKSLTPSYLKVTTYTNYGTTNQSKSVDVFKLSLKNVNRELFKINATSKQRL